MFFTVIIPTRNRPELLKLAVQSVISQDFDDFEIFVVNDGSAASYDDAYRQIESEFHGKVKFLHLERSCFGHGQSYAMNMGAAQASGKYICFLDDDDFWIDGNHLKNAATLLSASEADLYFTNQECYYDNQPTGKNIWLAPLEKLLDKAGQGITTDCGTAYKVDVTFLMKVDAFCHLNTTIVRAELYQQIKGMDENLYYECDRDLYYRNIDNANIILFNPVETSRHNIPIKTDKNNMSTLVTDFEKLLFRLRLLDKAILHSKHQELTKTGKMHKIYTLKTICENLYQQKKYALAAFYAKEACLAGFTIKWSLFTIMAVLKGLIYGDRQAAV